MAFYGTHRVYLPPGSAGRRAEGCVQPAPGAGVSALVAAVEAGIRESSGPGTAQDAHPATVQPVQQWTQVTARLRRLRLELEVSNICCLYIS